MTYFNTRLLICCHIGCAYLALYGVLAPWYLIDFTGSLYDNARCMELIYLLSIAFLILAIPNWRQSTLKMESLPSPVKRGLYALFILAVISSLLAAFPQRAFQELSLYLLLFFYGNLCCIVSNRYLYIFDRLFVGGIALGALLFACLFMVSYQTSALSNLSFSWISPFVTFSNVRFFSEYQAYTLPVLSIPLVAFNLPVRWRVFAFLLLSIGWALHFSTGTRSLWFSLVITSCFIFATLRTKSFPWLKWQFFALITGAVLYFIFEYFNISSNPASYGLNSISQRGLNDNGRVTLWITAFDFIKKHPLLGIGPMHFAFNNFSIAAHPHNSLLHIASEYGIPFMSIIIYMTLYLLKLAINWCQKKSTVADLQINIALTASVVCGLCDSMFSGNIIMPQSQMMLFMISGWLIGRNKSTDIRAAVLTTSQTYIRTALLLILILSVSFSQLTGLQDYRRYMINNKFSLPIYAHPRFWIDGHWPLTKEK